MKWYGKIAYSENVEVEPDIWEPHATAREYFGDLLRNTHNEKATNTINNSITINNQLSVVADSELLNHLHSILWVTFGGVKWRISSVSVEPPRLVLTFSEPYLEDESDEG